MPTLCEKRKGWATRRPGLSPDFVQRLEIKSNPPTQMSRGEIVNRIKLIF